MYTEKAEEKATARISECLTQLPWFTEAGGLFMGVRYVGDYYERGCPAKLDYRRGHEDTAVWEARFKTPDGQEKLLPFPEAWMEDDDSEGRITQRIVKILKEHLGSGQIGFRQR